MTSQQPSTLDRAEVIKLLREIHGDLDKLIEIGGASASDLEEWRERMDAQVLALVGLNLRDRRRRR